MYQSLDPNDPNRNMEEEIKLCFKNFSNAQLIKKFERVMIQGLNEDDEIYELHRRGFSWKWKNDKVIILNGPEYEIKEFDQ